MWDLQCGASGRLVHVPGAVGRWCVLGEVGTGEPQRALIHSLYEQEELNSHTPDFFDISLSCSPCWWPGSLWLAGTTSLPTPTPFCCFAAVECSWLFPASDSLGSKALGPPLGFPDARLWEEWGVGVPRPPGPALEVLSNSILGRRTH